MDSVLLPPRKTYISTSALRQTPLLPLHVV
jgi:hypothetical protein